MTFQFALDATFIIAAKVWIPLVSGLIHNAGLTATGMDISSGLVQRRHYRVVMVLAARLCAGHSVLPRLTLKLASLPRAQIVKEVIG